MIFTAPIDVEPDEAWLSPDPSGGAHFDPAPWTPPRFRPPIRLTDAEESHLLAADAWEVSPRLASPEMTAADVARLFDVPSELVELGPGTFANAIANREEVWQAAQPEIAAAVAAAQAAFEEVPDPRYLNGADAAPCLSPTPGQEYCTSCGWTPVAHMDYHGTLAIVSGKMSDSIGGADLNDGQRLVAAAGSDAWRAHMPARIGFADDGRPENLDAQRTAQESAADELATGYHVGNGALSPAAVAERVEIVTPPSESWGDRNARHDLEMAEARRSGKCRRCRQPGHLNCGAPGAGSTPGSLTVDGVATELRDASETNDGRVMVFDVAPEPFELAQGTAQPSLIVARPGLIVPEPPALVVFSAPILVERGEVVPLKTREKRDMLIGVVKSYAANDPRKLQKSIGPSEIGDPCDARVLRTALGFAEETTPDPWASFVGQAVHAKLADAFEATNASLLGGPRFQVEQRVYVTDDIYGTTDLYDTGDVIDHKIVGTQSMTDLKRSKWDANPKYRTQLDLYALGWSRAGHTVHSVTLAVWPRSGFLDGLLLVEGTPDLENATRALERLAHLRDVAAATNAAEDDTPWQDGTLLTVAGKGCGFCPWFKPNLPLTRQTCPKGADYQSDKGNGRGPRKSVA